MMTRDAGTNLIGMVCVVCQRTKDTPYTIEYHPHILTRRIGTQGKKMRFPFYNRVRWTLHGLDNASDAIVRSRYCTSRSPEKPLLCLKRKEATTCVMRASSAEITPPTV